MAASSIVSLKTADYPSAGAFRLHRAPTQLRPRDGGSGPDRYDDPRNEYRVRYFASTLRGSLLEVLDHFRGESAADTRMSTVAYVDGLDILEEEPPGLVPDLWLSQQRLTVATPVGSTTFVDVTDPGVLATFDRAPAVQHALKSPAVRQAFGVNARLDLGTICAVGPAARMITQAVSQTVYLHPARPAGISYVTRFDSQERCWAVFDDRVILTFSPPDPLDHTDPKHRAAIQGVASLYGLHLPARWRN